jgi:hypothetical protein
MPYMRALILKSLSVRPDFARSENSDRVEPHPRMNFTVIWVENKAI